MKKELTTVKKKASDGMKFYTRAAYEKALPCFEQVLRDLQSTAEAKKEDLRICNYNLGSCHLQMKNYEEAAKFLSQAVELNSVCKEKSSKYEARLKECQDQMSKTKEIKELAKSHDELKFTASRLPKLSDKNFNIYIPQGKSARLQKDTARINKISGLLTNEFSTCNIIVAFNAEKMVLIHADLEAINDFPQIVDELKWVGKFDEITIRILYKPHGKCLLDRGIKDTLSGLNPKDLEFILIDKKYDAVYLSFDAHEKSATQIHERISLYGPGENIPNLLHHPREQQFLAVRKIEQLIGLYGVMKGVARKKKHLIIFNGSIWEPLFPHEYEIDKSHSRTQDELKLFKPKVGIINFVVNLSKIADFCTQAGIPMMSSSGEVKNVNSKEFEIYMDIGFYLQRYFNEFDANLIFQINIANLVSTLSLDISLPENIENIILSIKKYEENAPYSSTKDRFLRIYHRLYKEYLQCNQYAELKNQQAEKIAIALNKYQKAEKLFIEKMYKNCINLFFEFICQATLFCTRSSPEIRKAYLKFGLSLLYCGEYQAAEGYLKRAEALLAYVSDPAEKAKEAEQIAKALQQIRLTAHTLSERSQVFS